MKRLQFDSISIVSERLQMARRITFRPGRNLLFGPNSSGKTTLVQTLYLTLGARPMRMLHRFAEPWHAVVELSVDGERFSILYWSGSRALFGADGVLIAAAHEPITWNDIFRKWIGFELPVAELADGEEVFADIGSFFSLFYFDQDVGWNWTWRQFESESGVPFAASTLVEYFSGIRSADYFGARSHKKQLEKQKARVAREKATVASARKSIIERMKAQPAVVEVSQFRLETEALSARFGELTEKQAAIRANLLREAQLIAAIRAERANVAKPLAEFRKDWDFLAGATLGELTCPTCGAQHQDLFGDLFRYAQDVRVLEQLDRALAADLAAGAARVAAEQQKLNALRAESDGIAAIMQSQNGPTTFSDVVNAMASAQAAESFDAALAEATAKIAGLLAQIESAEADLKNLTTRATAIRSELTNEYESAYRQNCKVVHVPGPAPDARPSLVARPRSSGSQHSRQLLAHSAALWAAIFGRYGVFLIPIVIDDSMQKGQDPMHANATLNFCAKRLPTQTQVIVTSERNYGFEAAETVDLGAPGNLLQRSEFESVSSQTLPLLRKMHEELNNREL